jgi:hypothetical protein
VEQDADIGVEGAAGEGGGVVGCHGAELAGGFGCEGEGMGGCGSEG